MTSISELRRPKIFNMALFDLIMTFVGAFVTHLLLWLYPLNMKEKEKRTPLQYISSLILIFITFVGIGVIAHRIFNIQSALSAYLGFNDMPMRQT
jgi:small-conductance mechanosensitive channel